MDEVVELLKTWELPKLIPVFEKNAITIQALSALTSDDVKDIIPQTGPRVLFMRCWRTWKTEFSTSNNTLSLSNLELINFEIGQEVTSDGDINPDDFIIVPAEKSENVPPNNQIINLQESPLKTGILESILVKSLEASSLLIYKGGTLDGDATRNLLASIIAKEILNEHTNSPIQGSIYFKWANFIKELFPGERITTYYIPACTTASGAVLQARGKLAHQVLNKRRRLQQLGALTSKEKRKREESPAFTSSSPRPLPASINNIESFENVTEDLQWLRNSSEPWSLVETKWRKTFQQRSIQLHNGNSNQTLESYFNEYPALKKPYGYALLTTDFKAAYAEEENNLFIYFPIVKIRILELLKKKKTRDNFALELLSLADSFKEEDTNVVALLSIPYLLNSTTVKSKNKLKGKPSFSWKPSKSETRDAFIKHLTSDAEINQYRQNRLKSLQNKGVTSQPYVIIVGESLNDIKSYLVVINESVIYKRDNILQSVDTCYKAIWALNAEYGVDSYAIWYFVQRAFYKMTSTFDKGSTSAESLLTDCNISYTL